MIFNKEILEELDKIIQGFCRSEMCGRNDICLYLADLFPKFVCKKCPLYLFKLELLKEIK